MSNRKWQYGLTADEWFHLTSEGHDSEVAPCCGNIGQVRDTLRTFLGFQAPEDDWWRITIGRELLDAVEADGGEHDLQNRDSFPLLNRVLDGIRGEIEASEEKNRQSR